MGQGETIEKPGIPKWAMQPFGDFLDFVDRLGEVVEISAIGISHLQSMPRMLELAGQIVTIVNRGDKPDVQGRLERSRKLAQLAEREAATDFPLIHSQATVSLWGALEDFVRTFVAKWLQNVPSAMLNSPLISVKVAIGEYERLSSEEKGLFLAEALERTTNATFKQGVSRFEAVLEPLGFSGSVPDGLRRDIFELGQVRNAIAHRRGIADRRLLDACPWITTTLGRPISISRHDLRRYHEASVVYAMELMCRVGEHFGVPNITRYRASELLRDKADASDAISPKATL